MAGKKKRQEYVARGPGRGGGRESARRAKAEWADELAPAQISGRWLLGALAASMVGAVICAWCGLCLIFWQGSWQMLYHPAAAVERTPASVGLAFDKVGLAATDAGTPRLAGWWIAAAPDARFARLTVLYLHGQDGNLGDTVDALTRLHATGVNVLAFDYRGYGQSQFVRPSEQNWRQDTEWALEYLEGTRHVAASSIVLDGVGVGADLALEEAGAHPELAGVIAEAPLAAPTSAIFNDARARLVPTRMLVRDRWNLDAAAADVRVPVLWIASDERSAAGVVPRQPEAYGRIAGRKMLVWVSPSTNLDKQLADALARWLDGLAGR